MKKYFITAVCCIAFFSTGAANNFTEIEIEDAVFVEPKRNVALADSDACRATCTISVNGIGFTASAGGIFTSCSTATERACAKVRDLANSMMQHFL